LTPANIVRQKIADIRIDGKMPRDIDPRDRCQHHSDDDHLPRVTRAEIDDPDNE
jgi:hypothetical protein